MLLELLNNFKISEIVPVMSIFLSIFIVIIGFGIATALSFVED